MGVRDAFGIRVGFMSTGRGDRERTGLAGLEVFGIGRPLPFARPLAASEAYGEEYVRARWNSVFTPGFAAADPLTRVLVGVVRPGVSCC